MSSNRQGGTKLVNHAGASGKGTHSNKVCLTS
jgi:hypothetical protein